MAIGSGRVQTENGNRHFPFAYRLSADFVPVGDLVEWLCHPIRPDPLLTLPVLFTAGPLKTDASGKNSGESFSDALLCGSSIKFLSTNFPKDVRLPLSLYTDRSHLQTISPHA